MPPCSPTDHLQVPVWQAEGTGQQRWCVAAGRDSLLCGRGCDPAEQRDHHGHPTCPRRVSACGCVLLGGGGGVVASSPGPIFILNYGGGK